MKKVFLCTLLISVVTLTYAQRSALGLEFGFAQTDYRVNSPDPNADPSQLNLTALNGFKLGFVWDVTYIKGFGSTIGLRYTYGTKLTSWEPVDPNQLAKYPLAKDRFNYNQLELVVDWQYKFEIAGNTYLILTTGPSIQVGIERKDYLYIDNGIGETVESKVSRYDYSEDLSKAYNRVNIGWGIGAGFQYDRFYIRGGYDFGLLNPYKIKDFTESPLYEHAYNGDSRYTRGRLDQWHIRLGFYFMQWDDK